MSAAGPEKSNSGDGAGGGRARIPRYTRAGLGVRTPANRFPSGAVPGVDVHDARTGSGQGSSRPGGSAAANGSGAPAAAPTDEELLGRCRSGGDPAAFETLVHRYEHELFSYLRRYLGSAEMAEDVFQATFLQVHLKKEHFEEGRRFRPWLYAIATNQAIDAQRRNRRHRMASLDARTGDGDDVGSLVEMLQGNGGTAVEELENEEAREWVRSAVDALPETLRGALLLVYHQGLKYREAADVLGIPVGTVKSRLNAALVKLNESWQRSRRQ